MNSRDLKRKRKMKPVVIIEYGAGNVYSVARAVERLGFPVICGADEALLRQAGRVILPGVGQAATAMRRLRERGLDKLIPRLEVPVLGICLGMQLMCKHTEEGGTEGLGIFPVVVERFRGTVKVPHVGWNTIGGLHSELMKGVDEGERVYFVHSYRVSVNEWTVATCDYAGRFSAAMGRNNFWGCQFHPEKSDVAGQRIIRNFLMM